MESFYPLLIKVPSMPPREVGISQGHLSMWLGWPAYKWEIAKLD